MIDRFCSLAAAACLATAASAADFDAIYGEVYVERPSGPMKADLYVPKSPGPHPGVLVVHGGAWYTGTRAQLAGVAETLARRGFTAVAISYRLAPTHPFPAQIEDCRAALTWMRANAERLKLDRDRIGGFGYSAGAQLVALLAVNPAPAGDGVATGSESDVTPGLQAVVGGGAPCDFRVLPPDNRMLAFWLGGSRRERPEQYRRSSPAAFVSGNCPPMFFFHGQTDRLVPAESPQQMVALLRQAGVRAELYMVPKLGHVFAMMDVGAIEKSIEFLAEELEVRGRR